MFRDWVSDHYRGSGDTRAAWTEEWMNETGFFDLDPPPGMRGPELEAFQERAATICRYFDFDAYSRDLECSGFTFERSASGVLVFSD
jgi:antirestriction protein